MERRGFLPSADACLPDAEALGELATETIAVFMGIDHVPTEGSWKRSRHHQPRLSITGPPAASNPATIQLPLIQPTSIHVARRWWIDQRSTDWAQNRNPCPATARPSWRRSCATRNKVPRPPLWPHPGPTALRHPQGPGPVDARLLLPGHLRCQAPSAKCQIVCPRGRWRATAGPIRAAACKRHPYTCLASTGPIQLSAEREPTRCRPPNRSRRSNAQG